MVAIFFLAVFLFLPDMLKMQDETLSMAERANAADRVITLHIKVWPAAMILADKELNHSDLYFSCTPVRPSLRRIRRLFGRLNSAFAGFVP